MPPVHSPEINAISETSVAESNGQLIFDPGEKGGGGILRKVVVSIVILVAVSFTAWKINYNLGNPIATAKGKRQSSGGDRATPVLVAIAQQKTMPIYLTGLGTVTPYSLVTIKSRVDGELVSVNVREGQRVHKGQLLAQIDPAPYAAAAAQVEGQLSRDKATANYAGLQADRYHSLYQAGVVSRDSEQLQTANAGQTAGAVEADVAALRAAKVNLAYTRITSPIDGVVGLRQVDAGNIVRAADATGLLIITQVQPITVIFTLAEDELPQVQSALKGGDKLEVEAYDRSQATRLAKGKLLTLDNLVDVTTGTDKAKAAFDNRDNTLFPNQFVNIRLLLKQRKDSIVIPAAAVQSGSQGNFVYVMKKGDPPAMEEGGENSKSGKVGKDKHKHQSASAPNVASAVSDGAEEKGKYYVEVRSITIDVTEGDQVIVGRGLASGEQVVIDGLEKLRDLAKVTPAKEFATEEKRSKKSGERLGESQPTHEGRGPSGTEPAGEPKAGTGESEHHHRHKP
jgi:multidrug efflux system membrane fusion protein